MGKNLAFLALILLFAVRMARAGAVTGSEDGSRVTLRNERLTISLGKAEKGAVVSLVDNASGTDFAAPQRSPRLFALTFSNKDEVGGQRFTLSSFEAKTVRFALQDPAGQRVATVAFDEVGGRPIHVSCTATVSDADPLVRWRLSVKFPDSLVLEEVQFPFCVLRAPLGKDVADDAAIIGRTKGGVIRKPGELKVGARIAARQPGSLAAQFACYYDSAAGFYTATYDAKGYPKDFEMRRAKEGVEMDWDIHCFTSEAFSLDFDVVLTTFTSADKNTPTDWRDAADIYKEWALKQPWCARPYTERKDIPEWMKAGPAMVRFGRNWLANPKFIEKWLKEYWCKYFHDTPLITAYWGWEKVGSWITPDYFPVYPSDEQFKELVAMSRKLGCHAFLWPSGYHWTMTYQKRADGSFFWDDRKRFDEVASPHAVRERDGKINARKCSWLAGGENSCMCPGDPWTIQWWNREIVLPIAQRGGEIVQVDQVVGGGFPFCYSRTHGHTPGPGLWMTEEFSEQLRTAFAEGRKVERDFVIGIEEPNERFNDLVGIQDYRDCESPHELASVFNYLYHEFLPTFQSNPRAGDTVMAAYCLVNGQIPHMVPEMWLGEGNVILNGQFEEWAPNQYSGEPQAFGWDQVKAWRGETWTGKFFRDEMEKHGGNASLRLENPADSDTVQVSQNVAVGAGISVGKKYRLSAWMKTDHMARPNAIGLGLLTSELKSKASSKILFPVAGSGWSYGSAEFSVPEGTDFLRIMIHISGKARAWVDDMALEELLPDGRVVPALRPDTPPGHKLMKHWVELFHGEGRPYLLFGRMLHPPKLETATITHRGKALPAIMHNAFRAPDGSEAVILANGTGQRQAGKLIWKGKTLDLALEPEEARFIQ